MTDPNCPVDFPADDLTWAGPGSSNLRPNPRQLRIQNHHQSANASLGRSGDDDPTWVVNLAVMAHYLSLHHHKNRLSSYLA